MWHSGMCKQILTDRNQMRQLVGKKSIRIFEDEL
jgi:hypothetical protein